MQSLRHHAALLPHVCRGALLWPADTSSIGDPLFCHVATETKQVDVSAKLAVGSPSANTSGSGSGSSSGSGATGTGGVTCAQAQAAFNLTTLQNNILANAAGQGIVFVCAETLQLAVSCASPVPSRVLAAGASASGSYGNGSRRRLGGLGVRAAQVVPDVPTLVVDIAAIVSLGQETLVRA